MHTCYVPAGQFTADTARQWGDQARAALDEHGPLPRCDAGVEELVRAKLAREPVEDLRIDFEDGYGPHTDDEEDDAAAAAARALAGAVAAGTAPPFSGLRMKCLEEPVRRRAVRTLDRFLATLAAAGAPPSGSRTTQPSGSRITLPPGFRVTLPKVTSVAQVAAMAGLCAALEAEYALPRLDLELQVETPQAVLGPDGTALVAPMLAAADGRCVGLHFGTYDYTAALGIAAGVPEPGAPGRGPRQGGHAGGRGGHRRGGERRLAERAAGGDQTGRQGGLAAARRPGQAQPGTRLLPGLGPAPGAAAVPVRGHVRLLP